METLYVAMWSKSNPAWGSGRRIQRNYYAYLVTMALTGGHMECPACLGYLDLDTAEVDRCIPELDYTPGNVVYVCHGCNHGRGILQSNGGDWTRANDYADDVRTASAFIRIPAVCDARQWWSTRHTVATTSRYA